MAFFFFSSGFGSRFIFIFYSTWSFSLAIYSSIYIFKRLDSTGTCWLSSSMMIINDFDYIFGNGFFFASQSQLIMLMPGNIPIHKNIRNSHFMMVFESYDHHTLNFLNCCTVALYSCCCVNFDLLSVISWQWVISQGRAHRALVFFCCCSSIGSNSKPKSTICKATWRGNCSEFSI